jgi:hypothetical protein
MKKNEKPIWKKKNNEKRELKRHVKIKGPPTSDNEKKKWEVEGATYIVPCIKKPLKVVQYNL